MTRPIESFVRALSASAFAGAVAIVLTACGGLRSESPNASIVPGPPKVGVGAQPANLPVGPTIRVMPDGSVIHIYLPPWERPLVRPDTAPVQYHGDKVVDNSKLYAIFWKPAGFYMSPKYMPVIKRFFNDVGVGTKMYDILVQYGDKDGKPANASALGGAWVDTRAFPSVFNDGTVQAEVKRAIGVNHWPAGGYQPIFVVFTASKANVGFAYCAYHGNFLYKGQQVLYSILPYQHDIAPDGCGTPTKVFPNDRDADQTIDTLWHEEAETISDPVNAWWRNSDGSEIGDICQTSYGPRQKDGRNVTLNGHGYITQELQSNKDGKCVQQEP